MSDENPLIQRIDTLRLAGDYAHARALVSEGLPTATGSERARLKAALGRILLDLGEKQQAVGVLEEAAAGLLAGTPGERAELLLDLGRARRRTGELLPGLEALEAATELFATARNGAGRRRALAARGKVHYALHDWKAARGAFRAALDQQGDDPPSWRLHHAMARAYEKDGRRGDAENCYERARQAGWDGLRAGAAAQKRLSAAHALRNSPTGAPLLLTASAGDSLVEHDDETELLKSALKLEKEDLVRLVALAGALNSALAPQPLLELLLDRAIEWSGSERGYVVIARPRRGEEATVEVRVARTRDGEPVENPEDEVSRGIVREVCKRSAAIVTEEATEDVRLADMTSVSERSLRSVACLPLRVRSGPALGALYLEARDRGGAFGVREQGLLEVLAHHVALAFERSTRYQRLAEAYNETRRALEEKTGNMFGLIGKARAMRQVFRLIEKLRDHHAPVLIEGETGTGKELVARAIHRSSQRREGPFVVEACGSLPEGLLESELFGHEKGAFTGATEYRRGAFERAEGGTLFLDEVGDMPVRMQALLLRVLEIGEVRPLGSPAPRTVDCRIVCASRENLAELVRLGKFRQDLYFRINVIRLEVPPLRNRKEDIPTLAEAFLKELRRSPNDMSPAALEVLLRHSWPGNIRELRHALERATLLAGSGPIEPRHLGLEAIQSGAFMGRSSRSRGLGRQSSGTNAAGKVEWHGFVLNRRQVALMDYLRANGVASNREYVQLVNVSVPTGWRDLKDLLDKGLVRSEGQGRNTVYRLTDTAPVSESD